jgi:diguanylate cyclase (GGDEF)-like protein/PAS domain S-box-containing protein
VKISSIRTHLLLLVMAVSIPIAVAIAYDIYDDMQENIARTKLQLRTLAQTMAKNLDNKILNTQHTLERLATRPRVRQLDPEQCDDVLEEVQHTDPDFANLFVTDLNGRMVCSVLKHPNPLLAHVTIMPWFQQFRQQSGFMIGDPGHGRLSGRQVTVYSQPVLNDKKAIIGGIHLPIDLHFYDPRLPVQSLPLDSRFGVFTPQGILVWRNLDPEKVIGTRPDADAARKIVEVRDGEFESVSVDHVMRYFSVASMPHSGMVAFVGVPVDSIQAQARQHALTESGLYLACIGLLCLLASLIARRITIPVRKLAAIAQQAHNGDLSVRAAPVGPREVVEVAQEFNHLLATLQNSNAQLLAFLDNRAVIAWLKDENGVLQFASDNFLNRFGLQREAVIGKNEFDIWPDEFARQYRQNDQTMLTQGCPLEVVEAVQQGNGELSWWLCNKFIFKRHDGVRLLGGLAVDITENRRAELRVRESESRYERAINGANDGIWEWDIVNNAEYLSPRYKQLLGYEDGELPNVRESFTDQLHPDERAHVFEAIRSHLAHEQPYALEMRLRCKNGAYRWFFARGQARWDEADQPVLLAGSITDITERKRVESDLRIAAIAFEAQEGMCVTDLTGNILRVNRAFTRITGFDAHEVMGKNPRLLKSGRHNAEFFQAMWAALAQNGAWEGEIWNRRKDGEVYPEYLIITAVKDHGEQVSHYVATFNDITKNKAAETEIMSLAFYDPLTRLPNRRLLLDRLKQALASSTRSGHEGGILFIDLDNFKILNDTLGHNMGDMLLLQVAQRLSSSVRDADTVARLGGDEFVVMLEDLSKDSFEAAAQTESVGKKILAALNRPYLLNHHEHRCSASIGATLFSNHETSIDELLQQADIAMYQAKNIGRNVMCFFDPQMQTAIAERAALENELHKVLLAGQFRLFYQVQVDHENKVVGAEALLRWLHPQRGLIPPGHFIPVAEETGLILPIGEWVLETACAQLKLWQLEPAMCELVVAVNVSAKQFRQANFVAQVKAIVEAAEINPARLKLELTESMLQDKIELTIETIMALKQIGVQFSLDDFGTGYSSLQYLKKLPLDQLKIDQSFIRDLATDANDKAIVRTIIAMAKALNLEVIAEGVETEEQRRILMQKGCRNFQGYLFGKPMPIKEFEAGLKKT